MSFILSRTLTIAALLLPFCSAAADSVGAAIATRAYETTVRFEDGAEATRTFRRAGIEYWEGIADSVWLGVAIGYSENEGRDAARTFETVSGNFGALGLRFEAPLGDRFHLAGRAEYLVQRDGRGTDDEDFDVRADETRAELGPMVRLGRLELAAGASWRNLDYREIFNDASGERVRHADARDDSGAFAALGWRVDNDGGIALRYDAGAEEGWSLRFERTY